MRGSLANIPATGDLTAVAGCKFHDLPAVAGCKCHILPIRNNTSSQCQAWRMLLMSSEGRLLGLRVHSIDDGLRAHL